AMIPQGFGAGVGRVGPYYEQGNWYRGGAVQMLFIAWLYGEQNQVRPTFPPNTSQDDLIRVSKSFDLSQQLPPVDWSQALRHLPENEIIKAVDGPHGIFADKMPVDTGGAMIERAPNDPGWYKGGLWHDNMKINVPGFWFMSWYDVSIGPNLAAYNYVRKTARPEIADQQYAVIAPTLHCAYKRASENTIVGERSVGDARLNYDELTWAWFDHFLKGDDNHVLESMPKVRYYTMGLNKWQSSDARDTDFTVKLIDVYTDGRAYNLDETIQRMRYRNGYDKPLAWMEAGKVYKVTLQPMTTSNYFDAGHRIRLEVSSSNFPRFDRNLNTGGKNYDEAKGVVAHNAVHHSKQYPSEVKL